MNIFELFGTISLKDEGFKSGIEEAKSQGESLGSKFGSIMAGVGKATAAGLAAASTAFATFAIKSLESTGELEQNLGGSEAVFKQFAATVQEVGSKAFETMGLSQSDFLATANKMGALMQGSGLSIETSMNLSTQAMQRAADVASIMGIDTSAAMEAVAGAAKGNFTMMDNLGVAMNATNLEAYALSKGIETSWKEMDNAQKVGLAMEMFLEKTAYAAGNYAKENETLAGSLSTARAALSNFMSGAGDVDAVVNSFTNLAEVVTKNLQELLPRLTEGLTGIVEGLLPLIPEMFSQMLPLVVDGATTLLNGIVEILPKLVDAVIDILPQLSEAILNLIPTMMQAGIDILLSLIEGISSTLPKLIPMAAETITTLIKGLIDKLPLLVDAALQLIQGLADGIIDALPVLIEALPKIVKSIVDFLTNSLPELIQTGVELLTALIKDMPTIINTILGVLPELINSLINAILGNIPVIIQAGIDLLTALVDALPEIINTIVTVLPEIVNAIVNALIGNISEIIDAGVKLFLALVDNIDEIVIGVVKAIPTIITAIVKAFLDRIGQIENVGKEIIEGLWNGIKSYATWLGDKLADFWGGIIDGAKSFFGISSPSKLFEKEIGKNIPLGLARGIEKNSPLAVKAAEAMSKDTYKKSILWVGDYVKETEKVAATEEKTWKSVAETYAITTDTKIESDKKSTKSKKDALKEQEDAEKKAFDESKKIIENKKFFGLMTLEEEIKAWEEIQSRYVDGTEQRLEAEKALYTLRNQQEAESNQASFDNSKSWIDARKNLGLLSMQEEIEAWERVQARYAEGTDLRKQADQSLFDAQQRLFQEQEKMTEKMEEAEARYAKAVEDRTQAIFDSFGLFDELKEKQDKEDEQLKKAQEEYQKLQDAIKDLSSQREEANITAEKLSKLNEDYAKKQEELSKATKDLAKAQEQASKSQGQILTENLESQVKEMTDWSTNISYLSKKGINEGLLDDLKKMGPSANAELKALTQMTDAELKNYSDLYGQKQTVARMQATQELKGLRKDVDDEIKGMMVDLSKTMSSGASPIGENLVVGIIDGISLKSEELKKTMRELMESVVLESNKVLEIKSPSKVFKRMAGFVGQGFIDGIKNISKAVKNSVDNAFGGFGEGMEYGTNFGIKGGAVTSPSNQKFSQPALSTGLPQINQYIQSVPQSPSELAAATAAAFQTIRWQTK